MWFDPANTDAVFADIRRETHVLPDRSHGKADGTRTIVIDPDVLFDFRAIPYPAETFALVAFDPPHLKNNADGSWLAAKYGRLGPDWRDDLRAGFAECFRVLRADGVLIFKWAETRIKLGEVLPLAGVAPLFGSRGGRRQGTHWLVFMKPKEIDR